VSILLSIFSIENLLAMLCKSPSYVHSFSTCIPLKVRISILCMDSYRRLHICFRHCSGNSNFKANNCKLKETKQTQAEPNKKNPKKIKKEILDLSPIFHLMASAFV